MSKSLKRLLQPSSIAVLGGNWARAVIEQSQKMGFAGELWPVHPTHRTVCGLRCYASIDALPAAPDATFIGINRDASIDVVKQLAARGAGGAVCFASGFSEALAEDDGGLEREQALLEAAAQMPFFGPNCYGFINYLDGALLWPDQHGGKRVESGVAILTQSSNIAINLSMQTRGLPIAYVLTAGNQTSVSLAAQAQALLEDNRVTALGLHIEGFSDIRAFEVLAAAAKDCGKPIIALKVGKSDAARAALVSHTSSLAGADAAADTFMRRIGIVRVHSLSVFIETLKLLHIRGTSVGKRLLSMSCSGGEACLVSDAINEVELTCPDLNDGQHAALRDALGSLVALANPLDYHTYIWNDERQMQAMFTAMLQGDADVAFLVIDFPRDDRCIRPSWDVAIQGYKNATVDWHGTVTVVASLPENMPESVAEDLIAAGIVPLCGIEEALRAISAAAKFSTYTHERSESVWLPNVAIDTTEQSAVTSADARTTANSPPVKTLFEAHAKAWLAKHGARIPANVLLDAETCAIHADVQKIELACQNLQFPVVIKKCNVAHKSESGGVRTGIDSIGELVSVAKIQGAEGGCLIEEQLSGVVIELLIGLVRDPVHGLLLSLGEGGVQTELRNDVVHGLLPISTNDMQELLTRLRCYPILLGFRGRAGVEMPMLLDTLMLVQQAALSVAEELHELEINPLICTQSDCIVVDALMCISANSELGKNE